MKIFNVRLMSLVSAVFIFGLSCSEEKEINSEQLQQRGDELYYAVNKERPYSGKVVEFYESGQKRTERTFRNGKLHGLSTEWDSDGQKQHEIIYKDGQQTGPYRTWYDNGQQEKEGAYKDGKEDGRWVFWYANGQKQKEGDYKDGKRKGQWNFWTQNGQKLETGKVTDIDGNTYQTIKIGEQWWMAENLRATHYRNGNAIANITEDTAWEKQRTGAWCNYDNEADNAAIYGQLYNWYAVNDERNIAPEGWHVPTDKEWKQLEMYLGMSQSQADDTGWRGDGVGRKLMGTGSAHWVSPNTGSTNESGFSGLPGGYRDGSGGDFYNVGGYASFWSFPEYDSDGAWSRKLICGSSDVNRSITSKRCGFSVRCVRD